MAKVLYIDDNHDNRMLAMRVLMASDYEFEFAEADNAVDGIQLATNDPPDIILMDISMPDMDIYADGYLEKLGDKVSPQLLDYELFRLKDVRPSFSTPKSLINYSLVDHNNTISNIFGCEYTYDGVFHKEPASYFKVDFSSSYEQDSAKYFTSGSVYINAADSAIAYIEVNYNYQNFVDHKKLLGVSLEPVEYVTKIYFEKDEEENLYYVKWIIRTTELYVASKKTRDLREHFLYLYVTEHDSDIDLKKLPKRDKMKGILYNEEGKNIIGKTEYLDGLMKGSDLPAFIIDQ